MKGFFKTSLLMVLVLMVLCGVIYPLLITGVGQLAFNNKANGSMVEVNGEIVGSELIGQKFTEHRFFKGRPSAVDYNTYDKGEKSLVVSSGSSNLGPSNPKLMERVERDIEEFLKNNPTVKKEQLPADLFTESASGLDPNISIDAAKVQIEGVSKASGISISDLQAMIDKHTEEKILGVFGERRVNVLLVNLEIAKTLKEQGKL